MLILGHHLSILPFAKVTKIARKLSLNKNALSLNICQLLKRKCYTTTLLLHIILQFLFCFRQQQKKLLHHHVVYLQQLHRQLLLQQPLKQVHWYLIYIQQLQQALSRHHQQPQYTRSVDC